MIKTFKNVIFHLYELENRISASKDSNALKSKPKQ